MGARRLHVRPLPSTPQSHLALPADFTPEQLPKPVILTKIVVDLKKKKKATGDGGKAEIIKRLRLKCSGSCGSCTTRGWRRAP
jgi:hypothetical protein